MVIQLNNKLISNLSLLIDHELLLRGQAYTNTSSLFYPITGALYGLNAYATPYRQLVNDASITSATQMTGIYVSGIFIQPGQSGLVSLNIQEGLAYFSGRPTSVSGNYSLKDFSIYLTTEPEEKLLFETKFNLKQKYPQTITGLNINAQTYPVIFLKPLNIENVPFCIGGTDNKIFRIRAIVLGESEFQTLAACNILENLANKQYSVINVTGLPFDSIGGYTGVSYNYNTYSTASTEKTFVSKVRTSILTNTKQVNSLNPAIFPAFIDIELWNFIN